MNSREIPTKQANLEQVGMSRVKKGRDSIRLFVEIVFCWQLTPSWLQMFERTSYKQNNCNMFLAGCVMLWRTIDLSTSHPQFANHKQVFKGQALVKLCTLPWQVVNRAMLVVLGAQSFLSLLSSILPLGWILNCEKQHVLFAFGCIQTQAAGTEDVYRQYLFGGRYVANEGQYKSLWYLYPPDTAVNEATATRLVMNWFKRLSLIHFFRG